MIGIEGKLKGVEYEEGSGVEETDSNKAEYWYLDSLIRTYLDTNNLPLGEKHL